MNIEASLAAGFGSPHVAAVLNTEDPSSYNVDQRPRRDTLWTVIYSLLAAVVLTGSIPAFLRTDPNLGLYSNRFFNNSTSCDVRRYQQVAWMYNDSEFDPTFLRRFKAEIAIWLPVTAAITMFGSALYLFLFSRFPRTLLGGLTIGSLVASSALSAVCFATGALPAAITLAGCTAVVAGAFLWMRRWAHPFAQLMAAAAHSLRWNPQLLLTVLCIDLAGLLVLAYAFGAFFAAINYGFVSRNWNATQRFGLADENGFCLDSKKQYVPCCVFVTKDWAFAYSAAAALFLLWSGVLVLEVKTFTAADTLAQAYFKAALPAYGSFNDVRTEMPGAAAFSGLQSQSGTTGSVHRALRHCLAASFGSLALSALALAPLRALRRTSQALLRLRVVSRVAGRVLQPLASMTDKFSLFASISAALTGRPFVSAARAVSEMLQRNFIPAHGLWWLPTWLLWLAAALLSLAWSGLVFFATFSTNKQYQPVALSVSFATAGTSFLLMMYGLLFTTGLQLDAVHTLYICYAADVDQRKVTLPDVHTVMRQVPGQSVQHHRSALAYGQIETPEVATAAAAMVAPAAVAAPAMATADPAQLPPFTGLDAMEATASTRSGLAGTTPGRLKRRAL